MTMSPSFSPAMSAGSLRFTSSSSTPKMFMFGTCTRSPTSMPMTPRPGGRGVMGIDIGGRVQVPNMNIFGVELDDVNRNEPADIAGLKDGDIIIKFGDYLIRTPGDLRYRVAEALPGSTIPVTVVRGAQQIEIPVKIGRSRD